LKEKNKRERSESGPRFGLKKPWLRITCQLMKVKKWSCEDISNCAKKAGFELSVNELKWKIESLEHDRSHSPMKSKFKQLKKCMKKFLKSRKIDISEVRKFATEKGFKIDKIEGFFKKKNGT